MYGKKVKLRILFLFIAITSAILTIFLVLKSLEENIVYFITPTEIKSLVKIEEKKIRIGGMVKEKSIIINNQNISFIITDTRNDITVNYSGLVPNLFEEGKGVVAEGYLKDKSYFKAEKILAKHDENYMPPEIKKALGGK